MNPKDCKIMNLCLEFEKYNPKVLEMNLYNNSKNNRKSDLIWLFIVYIESKFNYKLCNLNIFSFWYFIL